MFGYIIPDKQNMYIKDFNVFRSFYCGLCKALHKTGAEHTRLCTSYDMTFFNVIVHSLNNVEVKFERQLCAYSMKKKVVVVPDELTEKVADITALLAYYKLDDDVRDGKKSRAIVRATLSARKRRAAKRMPEIDALMKRSFVALSNFEKAGCKSIDMVADCFATLMRDVAKHFVPKSDESDDFFYNLGRLVYLFDAVDDVQKDSKSKNYNPIVECYGKCVDKREYIKQNEEELSFLLGSTYNKLVASYNALPVVMYEGVLSNTVYLGIKMQMDKLLKGEEKCQLTRL